MTLKQFLSLIHHKSTKILGVIFQVAFGFLRTTLEIKEIAFSVLCYPCYILLVLEHCSVCVLNYILCVYLTSLCAVLIKFIYMLICDTEINQLINQIIF